MSRLYQKLMEKARQYPEVMTLKEGEIQWTMTDFADQVVQTALGFMALGVQPGEPVGLMLYNQKEFLTCFFALRRLGAVVVPLNIQMLPQDLGYVIQNAGLRRVVIDASLHPHLARFPLQFIVVDAQEPLEEPSLTYEALQALGTGKTLPAAAAQNDTELAFLIYTSGTSGHPKGVMLTENNLLSNMTGFMNRLHFGMDDHLLLALPMFHVYGLMVALAGMLYAGKMTLVPKFHPKQIVHALSAESVTILPLVPTLYSVVLGLLERQEQPIQSEHLRFCISGGASLPEKLLHQIEAALQTTVIEGYGLTETSPVIAVNDPAVGSIPNCVGRPIDNVSVKIVKEDGTDATVGEEGEVVTRGENVMLGYYQLPEETQAVLDAEGWLKTGDLGYLDAEGRLFISGRKKDLIIKSGENISPRPIEEALYHAPGVREAAVIGVPHEKWGEMIVACVSPKEGESLSETVLMQHCRQALNNTYVPDKIVILEELPKNPSGKILKKLLKSQMSPIPAA